MRPSKLLVPALLVVVLAIFGWINVREQRGQSITLVFNADPAMRIPDGKARDWQALSGELMQLDGLLVRLDGVTCPDPKTDTGREAMELLDRLLHSGTISCRITPSDGQSLGDCLSDTREFAQEMTQSGLCH